MSRSRAPDQKSLRSLGFPDLPLFVPALALSAFDELGVGVSAHTDGVWRSASGWPSVASAEVEHGADQSRYRYNLRCLSSARATRRWVRGELFGLHDLFVPLVRDGAVSSILVVGPYALEWPTSEQLRARWFRMTRTRGRLLDPAFARYLDATLGTLTLEGPLGREFERLVACFSRLVTGEGHSDFLAVEIERLKGTLLSARYADRMWEAAQSMVDEGTSHTWSTFLKADPLRDLGMSRPPKHVIVGLMAGKQSDDPVAQALARAAFQRASVALARKRGHFVSGRLGDRGITVLADLAEGGARARTALVDLTNRVAALARRFELRVHAGIALEWPGSALPARFRSALAAAERALSHDTTVEFAEPRAEPTRSELRQLRAALGASLADNPRLLTPRFDRYAQAVLTRSGYRLEATRADLQAGLERVIEPLLEAGVLDAKSVDEISSSVEGERNPETVLDLVGEYRRIVADVERAIEAPTAARQERGTRRALAFIHEHLAEPLNRTQVARVAGLAPGYFSRVLRREEGLSFEEYVQKHRLERAKHLLRGTRLDVARVAQLSGYKSRTTFQRLFKTATGSTPTRYRRG